jgi:CRISPR-associated protein (TIGR03984 family)
MDKGSAVSLAQEITINPAEMDKAEKITAWLEKQAGQHKLEWLLVHADDGLIWGRFDEKNELTLSGEAFKPLEVLIRPETLNEARVFSAGAEVLLWKHNDSFSARLIADDFAPPDYESGYEEKYLLWGRAEDQQENSFTLMREGQQGFLHAPPIKISTGKNASLTVRHYFSFDQYDRAYISLSRLVSVQEGG